MAEPKTSVLGKVRGSIGNITGRIRNGKNYLASKPASFKAPVDPASISRRAKFKLAVKFSYAVLKNGSLKDIWKNKSGGKGTPFSNLMKLNYKYILDNDLGVNNIITPAEGFVPEFSNVVLTNANLTADLAALNGSAEFDTNIETSLVTAAVVYLSDPVNEAFDNFDFISIESLPAALQLDNPNSISIDLKPYDGNKIDSYNVKKIYLAAATLNNAGEPVHYSVTFIQ